MGVRQTVSRAKTRGARHCTPQRAYHEGERVFSGPMTALWAEQHFAAIRRVDPEGLLFPIDVGWLAGTSKSCARA